MASLSDLVNSRRKKLNIAITALTQSKLRDIMALRYCDQFVTSSTSQAAYGEGYAFFGRMRTAGDALPVQFESVDPQTILKGADRRVGPYIRSQLFVALIAELEDFFSQLLKLVLEAYPRKIEDRSIRLGRILELDSVEEIVSSAADDFLTGIFYKGPADQRKQIEEVLSLPSAILQPLWPQYVEMKARRDIGMHSHWLQNDIYKRKLAEVGVTLPDSDFLGVDPAYFRESIELATELVKHIASHCDSKFA